MDWGMGLNALAVAVTVATGAMVYEYGRHTDRQIEILNDEVRVLQLGKHRVPCLTGEKALAVVIIGQSNAANFGFGLRVAAPNVVNLNPRDSLCYAAADPLLGAGGDRASFATRLGDIVARTEPRVILAPMAVNGSTVARWARGDIGTRLTDFVRQLPLLGAPINAILWSQGEADIGTPPDQYVADVRHVAATFRQVGIKAPMFVALETKCGNGPNEALRSAQRAVAAPELGTMTGPDLDAIDERADGCHFTDHGLDLVAAAWAKLIQTPE